MRVKIWMVAGLLLLSGGMVTRAQTSSAVKDDLFAGTEKFAQNAASVTEVDMDPDSLDMVNGHNAGRARRTVLSVVHTYTYEKPGMYNMADVDAFRNKLNTGEWHCSIHVRELKSGESTDVCRKRRTDDLEEQAIITVEPKELTFIHTIRRPSTSGSGKPGTPEAMMMPFELGLPMSMPLMDGMPMQAWTAEIRAQAAEMRALAMLDRAEMGGLPGLSLHFDGNRVEMYRAPGVDLDGLRDFTRQLQLLPEIKGRRLELFREPGAPKTPGAPAAPKSPAPASPKTAPQGSAPVTPPEAPSATPAAPPAAPQGPGSSQAAPARPAVAVGA